MTSEEIVRELNKIAGYYSVEPYCRVLNEATTLIESQAREITELQKDKERLDWFERSNASVNQLRSSPDAVKTFWHIWWDDSKDPSMTHHFGNGETALLNIRQSIDAAITKGEKR